MADTQLDLDEIFAAFSKENADLSRRAVLAEVKNRAYEKALEDADAVIAELAERANKAEQAVKDAAAAEESQDTAVAKAEPKAKAAKVGSATK